MTTTPRNTVLQHLINFSQVVASIEKLHLEWSSEVPSHFHVAGIKTFKDLHLFNSNHSTHFTMAYRFSRPHHEAEFQASILCVQEISRAALDIYAAYPHTCYGLGLHTQLNLVREDARDAAESICMLVPRNLEPDNGALGFLIATTLLQIESSFYGKYGYVEEERGCNVTKGAIRQRLGISID